MNLVHQEPTDLVLGVIQGRLLDTLIVLDETALRIAPWQVRFQVIGESHSVQIMDQASGHPYLQEILACVQLSTDDVAHYHAFHTLSHHHFSDTVAAYRYQITVDFHAGVHYLDHPGLEVRFPTIYGQQPVTQIKWRYVDTVLRWQTVHVYPGISQTTSVHTTSTFERIH